jgi:4-amino-4-deoxy-L-arabinose transferase-like glycosyltransferase
MNQSAALQNPSQPPAFSSHSSQKNYSICSIAVIGLLWVAIYLAGMFTPALLDDADSVHAEAAREMVLRHDWVTLHVNGIRYLEKAPLMYWGVAGSYSLFGVSDWSTRLPLMLGVLALLVATYVLGSQSYGARGGFYSALVLGTALGPYLFTRFLIPDILVGLWLALSFYFFLRTLKEYPPSRLSCWGLAVACALNVLTKGLIGLVFPVAVIGLYLILAGNLRHLLRMRLFSSTLIFFAVAAPWHILATLRNPDQGAVHGFLWFYFVNEHFLRYLNKRVPRDYDTVPLMIFWGLLLLWLLPWIVFLPQALKKVPVRWRELRSGLNARKQACLLFLLWAIVILLFFSFSTRQEYYTIPALPALALLVGSWLAQESDSEMRSPERRAGKISSLGLLAAGVAAFAIGILLLRVAKTPAPGVDLAELLKKNPDAYALSFGHFFDLTPQALGAFRGPQLLFILAFLLGTGLNWIFRRNSRPGRGNLALAGMMVVMLACVHSAFVTFSPIISSQQLALAIKKDYRPGDTIVVAGEYEDGSTLNFYTGIPLRILHEPSGNLWYGSQFPDAPRVFETRDSFLRLWSGSGRVFLWTDQEDPKELSRLPRLVLARSGGKSILTNR